MFHAPTCDRVERLAQLSRLLHAAGYSFVTPTPATHARVNARPSAASAQDLRDVFGWSRPFEEDVVPAQIVSAMAEAGVLVSEPAGWRRSTVRVSSLKGLLFLHSAYPTTAADSVFFGPDTYRFAQAIFPRLDSQVRRAVDIGCGAGPGAILMARALPRAEVLAVDVNPQALQFTAANAAAAGVHLRPVQSDLLSAVDGDFDLIVANPPYLVDPAERAYRHGGGPLGAGLSLAILQAACDRLASGGRLVLYTGSAVMAGEDLFLAAAERVLRPTGLAWCYRELDPDVFGEELDGGAYGAADRIAAVVLEVTKQ